MVLISRTRQKLEKLKNELLEENSNKKNLKILIIAHDFNDISGTLLDKVEREIVQNKIDVRIVINNVGHRYGSSFGGGPQFYNKVDVLADVEKLIKVNMYGQAKLCHYFIRRWEEEKVGRSLCINLSSFSAIFPMPLMCLYPATKQFNKYLALALKSEQKMTKNTTKYSTTFQILQPYFVCTGHHPIAKKPNLLVPTSDQLVKSAMIAVGELDLTTGHFFQDIYAEFVDFCANNVFLRPVVEFIVSSKMLAILEDREKSQ